MDGYMLEALAEFNHISQKQHFYGPSKMERPDYGATIQYVKEDTSKLLNTTQINYVQRVVGKFLYLGGAIDNTTKILDQLQDPQKEVIKPLIEVQTSTRAHHLKC